MAGPSWAAPETFAGGIVSLTYDDGLDSHLDLAVPALAARGLRGTFYITWDNVAERAAEWRKVGAQGHELANHTMTHPCDISHADWRGYAAKEIAPLNRKLASWSRSPSRQDFAYPCDVTDLGTGSASAQLRRFEAALQSQNISSARTSEGPPNSRRWAGSHPYRLQALAVGFDATQLRQVAGYIHRAAVRDEWAILIFHDIVPSHAKFGEVSRQLHEAVLDTIVTLGIRCSTVHDVMQQVGR